MKNNTEEQTISDFIAKSKEAFLGMKIRTVKRIGLWSLCALPFILEVVYQGRGPIHWFVEWIF